MGRPEIAINYEMIEGLAKYQHTYKEIAIIIGMSISAFRARRTSDPLLQAAFDRGKMRGVQGLRMAQMHKALEGDPSMLKWMGINLLNQSSKVEPEPQGDIVYSMQVPDDIGDESKPEEIIHDGEER